MKGQKTLSMVVSMSLISILIFMMVGVIQDSTDSLESNKALDAEKESISASCSRMCTEIHSASGEEKLMKAVKYCTERYAIGSGGKIAGSGYNSYCTDSVRCFNVGSCGYRGQSLDASQCRELMCKYFSESSSTGKRVQSYFEKGNTKGDKGAGTCDLSKVEDSAGYGVSNWWTENFQVEGGDYSSICG